MHLKDGPHEVLCWGWLRLLLGLVQMTCAAAGAGVLVTIGVHPLLWMFLVSATLASLLSRLLYRERSHPG